MTKRFLKKENPHKERRKNPRTGMQIWATEKAEGYTYFHLVSNLSASGLHIEKKLPLPMGATINLEIALSDNGETIPLKGIVVNTYKDSESNVTGTGIEFVGLSVDVKRKLETFIAQVE